MYFHALQPGYDSSITGTQFAIGHSKGLEMDYYDSESV